VGGSAGDALLPSAGGGQGDCDPETNTLYIFSNTNVSALGLVPGDPKRNSDMSLVQGVARDPKAPPPAAGAGGGGGEGGGGVNVQGLPLIKPPYGRITALDLNKGELAWTIAHGETPDNVRNHPALKGVTVPRTAGRDASAS
jgi:quinoprotein glucose dehydrogenase